MASTLKSYLNTQRQEILNRCTARGDCFRVCPIIPFTPLEGATPEQVAGGVLDVLRGKPSTGEVSIWAQASTRCGGCIEPCPEGVNPRKMVALCNTPAQSYENVHLGGRDVKV